MPISIRYVLLEKSIEVFSKPSGLKYDEYCKGYIHFSNRRHTKKIIPGHEWEHEKVLTLQKPVQILKKKNQNINPR